MTNREIERMLKKAGWYLAKHGKEHDHYRHPTRPGIIPISRGTGEIPNGTLAQIKKTAGLK